MRKNKKILYIDEYGSQLNEVYQRCWPYEISRFQSFKEGSQHRAVSIIGVLNNQNDLIAPFLFEDTYDSSFFNVYIEEMLKKIDFKSTEVDLSKFTTVV
ncbi:MAG: transposase [Oligoflexales bacterium]